MQCGIIFLHMRSGVRKRFILKKRSVANGGNNAWQVIINYAARAHGKMPHLTVSLLAPRQPHRHPGRA